MPAVIAMANAPQNVTRTVPIQDARTAGMSRRAPEKCEK